MHALDNPVRNYAWGSTTALAELAQREPTGAPEAELWMGAHDSGPSQVRGASLGLDRWIERDPQRTLGPIVAGRFGERLPFLFKVLAAAEPLSLQAHPSRGQAEHGYAVEDAAGIPLGAPHRLFKDRNHKPELLCAVQPFEALCGFAPLPVAIDRFERLAVPELSPVLDRLRAGDLREAFAWTMRAPAQTRVDLVETVGRACRAPDEGSDGSDVAAAFPWVAMLAEHYRGDGGVVASLFLNVLSLAPGEAIFLPAGNLHAYLRGVGVELMANSDNVLRGGLTPKHVDVDALLDILDFTPRLVEPIVGRAIGDRERGWTTPAEEFELRRVDLGSGDRVCLHVDGPEIALCLQGCVDLQRDTEVVHLGPLQSAFIEHADHHYDVVARAEATLFRAVVPSVA